MPARAGAGGKAHDREVGQAEQERRIVVALRTGCSLGGVTDSIENVPSTPPASSPAPAPAPSLAPPAASAGTWPLGDRVVNRIGFGAMRLTGNAAFDLGEPSDRSRSIAVLRRAVELGVNHIDTASFYFSATRSANELIARALAPYPDDIVIGTKVGPGRSPSGRWLDWARPDQLRGQVEENIRQLGVEALDLVTLRVYGTGPIGDHVGALVDLQTEGLIRQLGLSTVNVGQLNEAQQLATIVSVQHRYAVDSRTPKAEDLLEACRLRGIAFIPYFSIAGDGREQGAVQQEHPTITAVAAAHGTSAAQVRLAWSLQRSPNVLAIPGTGNPEHLAENVRAGDLAFTPGESSALDAVSGEA